ncbi:hypothetical protein TCE0_041r14141 [Talaromyces pinophilus]|uniref:Uncharacterized protein n=1 Tax=Talaromyces pinophilus TaxID=128442 RepID=A0A6V8HK36_TALPI|nr:hypothetical protein TCE0_041r14141 [Talaromyces pinophilus]
MLAGDGGGTKYAWDSATIIGLFCGAGGNLLIFLAWERSMGHDAMIPLALVRRQAIWSSCLNTAGFIGCAFTTVYYFPIWFQAVKGASPTASGVDMVPLIALEMATTVITGALIQRVGYSLPFVLVGSALTAIGTGLVTTLTPASSIGSRVGYQILQGCQGLAFQIPLLAVQTNVSEEQLAVATALVVFSQNLSGAVFLSLAEVIFSNQLRHELTMNAPGVDTSAVISAGASASGVRNAVPASDLPGVILAYSRSFDHVMYLAMGSAIGAFLFATCMGWVPMKKETENFNGEMVGINDQSA